MHALVDVGRQAYDTRLYAQVVSEMVDCQASDGASLAGRAGLARELVEFETTCQPR